MENSRSGRKEKRRGKPLWLSPDAFRLRHGNFGLSIRRSPRVSSGLLRCAAYFVLWNVLPAAARSRRI